MKNWAWEGAAHPMEDSLEKIKIVEPLTPPKNIISIPIEPVCDHVPMESIPIESVEFVKNSITYNVISDSAYLLALIVFISKIGKETFNDEELTQGYAEPIKEETQPGTNGQHLNLLWERHISCKLKESKEVLRRHAWD